MKSMITDLIKTLKLGREEGWEVGREENVTNLGNWIPWICINVKVAHNSLVRIRHARFRCSMAAITIIFRKIF